MKLFDDHIREYTAKKAKACMPGDKVCKRVLLNAMEKSRSGDSTVQWAWRLHCSVGGEHATIFGETSQKIGWIL